MPFVLTLRIALRALLTNKFRSFLTILGIIIGVAALIATWSISQGARIQMQEKIDQFGKDSIWIYGGDRRKSGAQSGASQSVDLKVSDWEVLSQLDSVRFCCPLIWTSGQMVYGSANWRSEGLGTTADYLGVRAWAIREGRIFSEDEVRAGACVVVLGSQSANKLFGGTNAVGKSIRLEQFSFEVIGVLEERGQSMGRSSQDDTFLVPYTTCQRRLRKTRFIHMILVAAKNTEQLKSAAAHFKQVLKQKNGIPLEEENAYEAYTAEQAFKTYQEGTKTFGLLTLMTASVCLLVGGIGITNTMMMSVGERTREIGVRMALGARPGDILTQFLIEALVLSGLGGLLGVALGFWAALQTAELASWPPVVTLRSLWLSFACAALIGLLSGVYPAWKASRLDPVEALRTD